MRKLIIVVLVVVALIVAADFGAAAVAEHAVAEQLRQRLGLSSDPSVRINGFPFLTQALAGQYSAIDVRAGEVSVGPLHDLDVEATLHDVDAPLSQVSSGTLQSVRAARVDGRVRIKDSDLGRAIGIADLRIQQPSDQEIKELLPPGTRARGIVAVNSTAGLAGGFSGGNSAPVRMVASTDLAGQRIEVIGIGVIELTGGLVRITIRDVRLSRDGSQDSPGEVDLPSGIRQTLLKTLSTDVKPGGLPFAVTPTRIWVETGSVVVEGTASNVTLGQAGPG
ncbi:MAG: LmeA family phospholipid-binding protein [Pseudonocardiaceae bacterium]